MRTFLKITACILTLSLFIYPGIPQIFQLLGTYFFIRVLSK